MKSASLASLAVALFAVAADPAPAQRDPARSMRLGDAPSTPEDLRALDRFSHCVAQRQPNQSAALLAMDFRANGYESGLRRLAQGNRGCAPLGRLAFSGVLLAGGLAEAVLQRSGASRDVAARTALDPARPPLQARDENELMSVCTVRAVPALVQGLLATEVASQEEAAAIRALMSQVGECLASGMSLRVNRPALRAALALATFRIVQHNAAAAPPAGN